MKLIIIRRLGQLIFLVSMKSRIAEPPMTQNLKLKQKSEVNTNITHASRGSPRTKTHSSIKVTHSLILYLNLDYFKLHSCSINKPHLHKQCVYYHSAKDYKRYGDFYNDIMCKYVLKNEECPNGEYCTSAHSRVEQLYQYQSYKKKFCSHFPNNIQKCEYGQFCSFAHSQEQIRIQLIHNYQFDDDFYMFHYKTEFCPFNLTEHDKSKCIYAHNLQDYRRNPAYYTYSPVSCPNWNMKDLIFDYNSGCDQGIDCSMCHGWKEVHYHPHVFRTTKCLTPGCQKGQCPNYHSEQQRRIVPQEYLDNIFKFVPRNRITKGTFKPCDESSDFILKNNIPKHSKALSGVSYMNSPEKDKDIISKTEMAKSKKSEDDSPSNKSEYHQYLLGQEVVESDDAGEDWSEEDDYAVVGHVQKLILDE